MIRDEERDDTRARTEVEDTLPPCEARKMREKYGIH